MNHFMDSDPFVIGERYKQLHRGVLALRIQERLADERASSGSRLGVLAKRNVRPLLREEHRAG
jgi:hypothetical protein